MSQNLDDEIKKAEIEKILAEKSKIEAERDDILRKKQEKWYKGPLLAGNVFKAIIAIPLLWIFFNDLMVPVLDTNDAKTELISTNAELTLAKSDSRHYKERVALEGTMDSLIAIRKSLASEIIKKQDSLNNLSSQLIELESSSKKTIDGLENALRSQKNKSKQAENLVNQTNQLRKEIDNIKSKTWYKEIELNSKYKIVLISKNSKDTTIVKMNKLLKDKNFDVHQDQGDNVRKSEIVYYDNKSKNKASEIQRDILDITNVNIPTRHSNEPQKEDRTFYIKIYYLIK